MTTTRIRQRRPYPWHRIEIGRNPPVHVNAPIGVILFDLTNYEVDKPTTSLPVDGPQCTSSKPPMLYGFIPDAGLSPASGRSPQTVR